MILSKTSYYNALAKTRDVLEIKHAARVPFVCGYYRAKVQEFSL